MAKPDVPRGRSHAVLRTSAVALLGAWFTWQIGTASVASLATRSANPALLTITASPDHPNAGSMLAQILLVAGKYTEAAAMARSVLLVTPIDDHALRVLGIATEKLGNREKGAVIMRQAAVLGWRDIPTQLWLIQDAAVRDDATTVIQRTDAIARLNQSGDLTRAIFLAAVGEPRLRAAFVDSLAKQPMWRGAFFSDVRQRLPAASTGGMETLFRDMQSHGQTISPIERLSYVDRLIDLGEFRRARTFWTTSFNIPAQRLATSPYDGSFALATARPTDTPASRFEWALNPDLVGTVTSDAGSNAYGLTIPPDLVGGTPIASQIEILPPGSHTLSAQISGPAAAAAAGWIITCLPSRQEVPRRLARGADDELSMVGFDVPQDGCVAQQVALTARDRADAQPVTIQSVRIR